MGYLGLIGIALGVVGAVAFLLAYGDRQRLKGTIESYQTTVTAYKEELTVTKEENQVLRGQVGECQGAIRVLTEAVTQSAKVEMLSHVNADQHRAIILKLEEVRVQFAPITAAILGTISQGGRQVVSDGSDSSVNH